MDTSKVVTDFLSSVADDPDMLKQFGIDPEKTIKDATGLDLTDEQMKDVIACIEPMVEGKGLNAEAVMKAAGDFLQGDGAAGILSSLTGLFGGGEGDGKKKSDSKDDDDGNIIGEIAESLFGGK